MNLELDFGWAVNKSKLAYALNDVKVAGLPLVEENIKAAYVKRAGLVRDDGLSHSDIPADVPEDKGGEEAPKKRRGRARE